MASRRLASSMTLSAGAKTNWASRSTKLRMSHGQATRSTFTRSRVIHFMGILLGVRLRWKIGTRPPERGLARAASMPERLAGLTLGFLARDADVGQQPVVEVEQSASLPPAIVLAFEDLH